MKTKVLGALLGTSAHAFTTTGKCSDLKQVPGFQNLDPEQITGEWFPAVLDKPEIEKMGYDPTCTNSFVELATESKYWQLESSDSEDEEYNTTSTGKTMEATDLAEGSERFFNRVMQLHNGKATGLLYTVDIQTQGEATAVGSFFGKTSSGTGVIVDTDYDTYIIGYGCEQIDDENMKQSVSISVRDPDWTEEDLQSLLEIAREKVQNVLGTPEEGGFNMDEHLMTVKQGEANQCTYYQFE